MSACQFCAAPTRRFGSTANVFDAAIDGAVKPFASDSGVSGVFAIVNAFDSGGCCASSSVIG